ncbi:helix-turn-helix domain-containing protein [Halorubrum sp. Atlit-28R]|uniref:helix-turn-helix domain-containing protein n=1 Tax=Halorubrum sp. Atlit-28R TaxID=2282129 RepID=UPI000EF1DF56|nr:helix-turn-helix domain-containing protein [Halorubrum sp. Atlit-28R]RLM49681.1 helix-turn-helix domain-containing protein [Halorubrum sp. Atlit-28R]
MKSITLEITVDGGFHPANRLLAADPSIIRESLHYVTILENGTIVLLYHLRGDLNQVRTYLTNHDEVISCDVPESEEGLVYIHGRPINPIREFFSLARTHGIVFETPITHTDNGLKITMSGDEQTLHRVISEIPSDIELTLLRKGERKPRECEIISLLTERQIEVLTVAVEGGYYETPRGTTHEKIAAQIGVTTTTVSEHLRKIEHRVFSEIVG